ncbi:MAG: LptF/LptG family permease [Fibrobacterota bacterium]
MFGLNTLQFYIFRRFLANLLLCLMAVLVIYMVIDYVGKIQKFSGIPLKVVGYYYIFVIPFILNLVISIVMLLSAMFTMGALAKNSEITAMRAAGLSIFYISRPVIYFALLVTLANIAFNETLMPRVNQYREKMYRTLIRKVPPVRNAQRYDFIYIGKNNVIYRFKGKYDAVARAGENVVIEFFEGSKLYKSVTCGAFRWDGKAKNWEGRDCVVRSFFENDSLTLERQKILRAFPRPLVEKPDDILREQRLPDEMNFFELSGYIESLKRAGQEMMKINSLRADLHYKLSLPFITFIVVVFGVSLTVRSGRRGIARVFGIGLIIGFLYYFTVQLGLGLGRSGSLHPVLGAWMGNLLFLPVSVAYFLRVTKFE